MNVCDDIWGEFFFEDPDEPPFDEDESPENPEEIDPPANSEEPANPEPPISPEEDEELEEVNSERDECYLECYDAYNICMQENANLGFNEAYYDTQDTQRIAILWANPGQASLTELHQRTMTATEFPARYSFSVFRPPSAPVMFDRGEHQFAFGLIVSFIDRNNDERLDIREEPIIGLNMTHGVMFVSDTGTPHLSPGSHLHRTHGDCIDVTDRPEEPEGEFDRNNVLAITGTAPILFDGLRDVDCDGDRNEWRTLCQMPLARNHCAARSDRRDPDSETPDVYGPICEFCGPTADSQ